MPILCPSHQDGTPPSVIYNAIRLRTYSLHLVEQVYWGQTNTPLTKAYTSLWMWSPLFANNVVCWQHVPAFILLVSKGLSTKVTLQVLVATMLRVAVAQKGATTLKALIAVQTLEAMRPPLMAVSRHTVFEQAWAFWTLQNRNGENLSVRNPANYSCFRPRVLGEERDEGIRCPLFLMTSLQRRNDWVFCHSQCHAWKGKSQLR